MIIIKKGQHQSNEWNKLFIGQQISADFIFDENSIYDLNDENQDDWNKLFGFADCFWPRIKLLSQNDERNKTSDFKINILGKALNLFFPWHWRSARFVWRYNVKKRVFEIGYYTYINGLRRFEDNSKTYELFFNKKTTMKVESDENVMFGNRYIFTIRDYKGSVFYSRLISTPYRSSILGIKLHAFFGGNEVAPNTIKINKQKC